MTKAPVHWIRGGDEKDRRRTCSEERAALITRELQDLKEKGSRIDSAESGGIGEGGPKDALVFGGGVLRESKKKP